MKCSRCGRDNLDYLRFCEDCGERLRAQAEPSPSVARTSAVPAVGRPEAPPLGFSVRSPQERKQCSRCGHPSATGDAYCPECGASLADDSHLAEAVARSSLPPPALGNTEATRAIHAVPFPPAPITTERPRFAEVEPAVRAAGVQPSLVVIAQDGTVGRRYVLNQPQLDIGRTEGDIQLPDDRFVCSRHGRLLVQGKTVTVQDLNSVNGIYRRVRGVTALLSGDMVLLGLEVLKFEFITQEEQRLSPAVDRGTLVFGTPAGPKHARLAEKSVEGLTRSLFVLTREETILGREVGDIVFSSDPFMSRRHAAINRNPDDGSFTLVDLGSSNGTFLRIRGSAELLPGDHLRVGQHLFRFDYDGGQGQAQAR